MGFLAPSLHTLEGVACSPINMTEKFVAQMYESLPTNIYLHHSLIAKVWNLGQLLKIPPLFGQI